MWTGPQVGRKYELRGLNTSTRHAAHCHFVGVGNVFDDYPTETDLEQFLDRQTVPALSHTHYDPSRPAFVTDLTEIVNPSQARNTGTAIRCTTPSPFGKIAENRISEVR